MPMFQRFTRKARDVIGEAQSLASGAGVAVGPEHILVAVSARADGLGAKTLRALGVDHAAILEAAGAATSSGESRGFTADAKKVLEASLREALKLGHNYIGTEHLLLAFLRLEGEGARWLSVAGASYDAVRAEVLNQLSTLESESLLRAAGETARAHLTEVRPGGEVSLVSEPLCPRCNAPLTRSVTYRTLDVPEQGGEGTASVLFLFCSACGHTLDDLILPGE